MNSKTEAIVLRIVKYSDRASIATLYTREYGTVSYMVYGLNSKKSPVRSSAFLPLSLVEIAAFHHPNKEIQQLKEVKTTLPLVDIYCDPLKNSLVLFIAELLFKSLKLTEKDDLLYNFIKQAVIELEHKKEGIANFHLVFMAKLSGYLGFSPNVEENNASYFDLLNGVFTDNHPMHNYFLDGETTVLFSTLLNLEYEDADNLKMSRETRNYMLDSLIKYYQLHVPEFGGLKSLDVLRDLFI